MPASGEREFLNAPSLKAQGVLLTPEQMAQFTGRRKKSLQIAWLEQNGLRKNVHYFVNAEGYPQAFDSLLPVRNLTDFELGEVR